jgi:hypothetical protein
VTKERGVEKERKGNREVCCEEIEERQKKKGRKEGERERKKGKIDFQPDYSMNTL